MTQFTAPAFIRSVDRLRELEFTGPRHSFSGKLTEWVHWTDASDLAAALDTAAPMPSSARRGRGPAAGMLADEVDAFRTAMVTAIGHDLSPTSATTTRARQQAMETGVAALRDRLRRALAAASPDMARLAAIDAVMERMLAPRERGLLAGVPADLPQHSDRLHDAMLAELDLRLQPVEGLLAALERTRP